MATAFEYDLRTGWPNVSLIPVGDLGEIAADVITSRRGIQYTTNMLQGKETAREELARMIRAHLQHEMTVSPDDLMLTTGALTGIDITCRTFTRPGDLVVVENPTFFFALRILKMSHVEIGSVPYGRQYGGMDLNRLEDLAKSADGRLKLVYAIPSFQNPTGFSATQDNRQGLIALAARYNFKILEDSTYQNLYFTSPPPPTLQELDHTRDHAITVGSVSKILMPSLRLGYIWAHTKHMPDLLTYKSDTVTSGLTAEIVADYLKLDQLYEQVQRARDFYGAKYRRMVSVLESCLPESVTWSRPDGGFFIWLTFPPDFDTAALFEQANAAGITFMPGQAACVDDDCGTDSIRLCFAYLDDDLLTEATEKLCVIIRKNFA